MGVLDFYCYDCESGTCDHVVQVLGTRVFTGTVRWSDNNVEVWRNDGTVYLVFRYDSDVCREVFEVPYEGVFSVP